MPVPVRTAGSASPLFLVHGRLGQALVSTHFLNLLGDGQLVEALQARGLDGLTAPHATVEAMAAEYLRAMRRVKPDGPVFMLSSRARIMASGNDDLRRLFTGQSERFEVTVGHTEILDPHNPRFVAALAECLARIRATVVAA